MNRNAKNLRGDVFKVIGTYRNQPLLLPLWQRLEQAARGAGRRDFQCRDAATEAFFLTDEEIQGHSAEVDAIMSFDRLVHEERGRHLFLLDEDGSVDFSQLSEDGEYAIMGVIERLQEGTLQFPASPQEKGQAA